jgi:hypothetical protein
MGHINTKMLHETYARWIKGADKVVQLAAMEAVMAKTGLNLVPEQASERAA